MQVPSRLNEYPVGMTSPTTDSSQPSSSMRAIILGSTLSEDEVPRTINSSSLMNRMKLKMLKPASAAMPPRTRNTKIRQVM